MFIVNFEKNVLVNDMLYTARNGCYPALVVGDGVLTLRPMFNIILTHTKNPKFCQYKNRRGN